MCLKLIVLNFICIKLSCKKVNNVNNLNCICLIESYQFTAKNDEWGRKLWFRRRQLTNWQSFSHWQIYRLTNSIAYTIDLWRFNRRKVWYWTQFVSFFLSQPYLALIFLFICKVVLRVGNSFIQQVKFTRKIILWAGLVRNKFKLAA